MRDFVIVLLFTTFLVACAYWLDHGNDDELNESDRRFADSHRIPWGEK